MAVNANKSTMESGAHGIGTEVREKTLDGCAVCAMRKNLN
jgi:hypothetical protein